MKLAIVGSRGLNINNLDNYLPDGIDEIVSGGARGIDACARNYAIEHNIKLTEFLPKYELYGRIAPIKRNEEIVDYADEVLAFWDGLSRGTSFTINAAKKLNKKVSVYIVNND